MDTEAAEFAAAALDRLDRIAKATERLLSMQIESQRALETILKMLQDMKTQ